MIVIAALTAALALLRIGSSVVGGRRGAGGESAPSSASPTTSAPTASKSSDTTKRPSIRKCADSSITVEASTDANTYPVGATPTFTMIITNTGDVTCKRDLGPKSNSLEVTSGGYHVWSSDDCNAGKKSKVTRLKAGQSAVSSITWNGRLSQKGCPSGKRKTIKAGRYELIGSNGRVASDPAPFAFTAN